MRVSNERRTAHRAVVAWRRRIGQWGSLGERRPSTVIYWNVLGSPSKNGSAV